MRDQETLFPTRTTSSTTTTGEFELSERQALRRVPGLSTELTDVTEVEYRQLRLERVVLVGRLDRGHQDRRGEHASPSWRRWPRRPARRCSKG